VSDAAIPLLATGCTSILILTLIVGTIHDDIHHYNNAYLSSNVHLAILCDCRCFLGLHHSASGNCAKGLVFTPGMGLTKSLTLSVENISQVKLLLVSDDFESASTPAGVESLSLTLLT
jgi:hypothetical protein